MLFPEPRQTPRLITRVRLEIFFQLPRNTALSFHQIVTPNFPTNPSRMDRGTFCLRFGTSFLSPSDYDRTSPCQVPHVLFLGLPVLVTAHVWGGETPPRPTPNCFQQAGK